MVNLSKNILRTFLLASYIGIIALVVSGVSAIFTYLNTGADRSSMLHTEIKKVDQYIPTVQWAPISNEGRPIDEENLHKIENDYLDAWYVMHVAYKTNSTEGVDDYFTDNARENIYQLIDLNQKESVNIESTTLAHHPTLEFFSEDGQLAVITDRGVVEYKSVYKDGISVLKTKEVADYKIVLLLEDGFWRIRHFVKEEVEAHQPATIAINTDTINLKGINYYPQETPWDMFGDRFDKDLLLKDFMLIKDAGLNSIRIFVQYNDFGKAEVNPDKLEKLKTTLDIAEETGLKVVLTLFDFYGDYSVLDWTLNERHAEKIVRAFKDHKAIVAWDIKNEPNLDFENRGEEKVIAWLENMIDLVKSIDSIHPVTIGWSNIESGIILKDKVDIISFHYYENLEDLDARIAVLKEAIPNKPIVLQEFGISNYSGLWKPFGSSEEDQAHYHQKIQEIIAANGLQFMSWTLYDFSEIPKEVVGRLPWRKETQKHFGFINKHGEQKASYKYISTP